MGFPGGSASAGDAGLIPGSVDAQYATGDQWRNDSRKNEETEPKQQQYSAVVVTGSGSKV